MTILLAFILLVVLIGIGLLVSRFIPSVNKTTNENLHSLEDLVERKKESNLKAPIFFFSLLVSILFVSWIFDSKYEKVIENKLYKAEEESLDSVFTVTAVLPPPPPKIEHPKPVVDQIKPIVPDIKEVDEKPKEKDPEPIDINEITEPIIQSITGTTGPVQKVDNTIYMGGELQEEPEFIGNLKNHLSLQLKNAKVPAKNRLSGKPVTIKVFFVVEKDGIVSDVTIPARSQVGLSESTKEIIVNSLLGTKWKPGKRVDQPVRVRLRQPLTIMP